MADTQVTHVTEQITPEYAEKLLKANRQNRPVKEWRVRMLARDMEEGNWAQNGEAGITLDWNGNIAGGQHTLHAVVRSGQTIICRVTRGVDPDVRHTMNDSLKQRFSDDLSVWGVRNVSESSALLMKILIWEQVAKANNGLGGLQGWRNRRFSRGKLAAEWPTYATGVTDAIQGAVPFAKDWPVKGNKGAMQFFYWLVTEKYGYDPTAAAAFFQHVMYGSQSENRMMFQRLWKKFTENVRAEQQVFWLIRVWNAWLKNENLRKLQEPKGGITDPYPKLRRP